MQRKVLKMISKGIPIGVLLFVIPWFFNNFKDYRFFWNVLTISAICIIFVQIIVKKEKKQWPVILWLLLSIIMANGWFSYQQLSVMFPILSNVSELTMLCIGLGLILLTIICAVTYNIYKAGTDIDRLPPADIQETVKNYTKKINGKINNDSQNKHDSDNGQFVENVVQQNTSSVKPKVMIGSIVVVTFIIVLGIIGTYLIVQNKEFLIQFNSSEIISNLIDFVVFFMLLILSICCLGILILAFISAARRIFQNILESGGKIDVQNDWILACISVLLTLFIYIFFRHTTMRELYEQLNGTNEIASLLSGVVMLIILATVAHVIYRVLCSCIKKEGMLHKYTDQIAHLLVKTVCELILKIIQTVSEVPDLYDTLGEVLKKAFRNFGQLLFEDEEEDI